MTAWLLTFFTIQYTAVGAGVFGYVWDELQPKNNWQVSLIFIAAITWPIWTPTWFVYHMMRRIGRGD